MADISPARRAAFEALQAVGSGRLDLGEALARARDPLGDSRDRALATRLVTGTLRWRGAIDYQLARFSAKRLERLDAEVLDALRLGVFEILHSERVPASAAVNDTVSILKASRVRSASGFANAILRRVARERDRLVWPTSPPSVESDADRAALIEHLSVVHSHPAWLVARWLERIGAGNTEAWLRFNNRQPALTLAANRLKVTPAQLAARLAAEGIDTEPTDVAPNGLRVVRGRALGSDAFLGGACLVQDEASQIVAELVQARPGQLVWDVCASPGGKSVAVASQCGADGFLVATDVRPRRMRLLAETLRRAGAARSGIVLVADEGPLPFRDGAFDRVLVDAPCSGLGTVRRDPDIRWRRQASDLPALARRQVALLRRVASHVAPGGRLIYSTCSSEPEENEAVVAAFLASTPTFLLLPVSALELPEPIAAMATAAGHWQSSPSHGLEAFFGAVLEKSAVVR